MKTTALKLLSTALLTSGLVACGNLSPVNQEGTTTHPVWPALKKDVLSQGTWPTTAQLHQLHKGMTKAQVMNLLGEPHFNEGLIGVREWDYVFHRTQGSAVQTCQFKVLFDKAMKTQSFLWKAKDCENF